MTDRISEEEMGTMIERLDAAIYKLAQICPEEMGLVERWIASCMNTYEKGCKQSRLNGIREG